MLRPHETLRAIYPWATTYARVAAAYALAGALAAATANVTEVRIRSSGDGTSQPAMFHAPDAAGSDRGKASPLIVSLHSWSTGHAGYDAYASTLRGCQQRRWIFISPHFRGGNNRPEACGSDLAVQDVLDAVDYAKAHAPVDARRIYVVGSAHMPLVLAHRAPGLWAGVSAWLPITDLAAFHRFNRGPHPRYAAMVEGCCGGPPGTLATDEEYRRRSPLYFLSAAKSVSIDINVGIFDGHGDGIVPIDQSLRAFNALAVANGRSDDLLPGPVIEEMTTHARVPAALKWTGVDEPGRNYKILFRRVAGPVRLTIYDGGHVWDEGQGGAAEPALDWIGAQLIARAARN